MSALAERGVLDQLLPQVLHGFSTDTPEGERGKIAGHEIAEGIDVELVKRRQAYFQIGLQQDLIPFA